jgi:hypothetical protein
MSSPKYASPIRFDINPSRVLLAALCLLHAGAVALLVPLALPLLLKISFALVISASLFVCLFQAGWIKAGMPLTQLFPPFVEVVWDNNDQWLLVDKCNEEYRAQLLPTSYVHARLAIVNLRLQDQAWYRRHRTIILMNDNIDSETFRRLRIRLRWYASQVPDSSAGPV